MDSPSPKILIVEDEIFVAMVEKKQLERKGYIVSHETSGEAAIERVANDKNAFNAILMDIDLGGGMDGTQAAERILKATDIPIVFVSSHTEPEIVEKTEKITSYGYVVKNSGIVILDAAIKMALKLFNEKMERQRAQKLQALSTEILGVLNEPLSLHETSQSIIRLIKKESGMEAVGIRLKDGDDFPYFIQEGFAEDFLLAENSLTLRDDNGTVCKGADGKPCLECTCGMVLEEQCGPPGDHVTPTGSIWTNDSLSLLNELQGHDLRLRPRDRCSHEGFFSIALIPIRIDQKVIGLLHMNDRRKNRLTPEGVHFFEELTATFAIAVKRKQNEIALHESEERIRAIFEQAVVGIAEIEMPAGYFTSINKRFCEIIGCSREKIVQSGFRCLLQSSDPTGSMGKQLMQVQSGTLHEFTVEMEIKHEATPSTWVALTVSSFENQGPHPARQVVVAQDITERKKAEEMIARQFSEKETMLREAHHRIKNNVASIESFLLLQIDSTNQPEVKAVLQESVAYIQSTRILYEKLLLEEDDLEISTRTYIEGLMDSLADVFPESKNVQIKADIADFEISTRTIIPVGIIISELTTNIFKHAFKESQGGHIDVTLQRDDDYITITIKDDGVGIDDHLDAEKPVKFGLMIVKMLAEQLKGSFSMENDNGVRSILRFKQ